ncbi:MAG: universal stress protein [Tahibacter sp.]
MKILLAVDGSECSKHAVKCVIKRWNSLGKKPVVILAYVDPPLLRRVAVALGSAEVDRYHAENASFALESAQRAFKRAKLDVTEATLVGEPGETLAKLAVDGKFDLVAMGSHGHGAFRNLLLGSVASKLISGCQVPVLILR